MAYPTEVDAVAAAPSGASTLGGSTPTHTVSHDQYRSALLSIKAKIDAQMQANASTPADPNMLALWYDTVDKILSVWDDTDGVWVGVTAPTDYRREIMLALGDETTTITATGNPKVTFRMPWAATLTAVRASVNTVSSSGLVTVDVNENGTTVLSTKLTIDASEKTSVTAATAAVISDSALADDAEITLDVDAAGTGAKGLKVTLYVTRAP